MHLVRRVHFQVRSQIRFVSIFIHQLYRCAIVLFRAFVIIALIVRRNISGLDGLDEDVSLFGISRTQRILSYQTKKHYRLWVWKQTCSSLPFDSWSPKNCQRIFRKRKWSRLALSPFPLTLSLSVSSCRMILSICYPVHKCICVCNIRPLSPFHCRGLVENDTHSNKQYVVILGTEKRRQRCEVGSDAITHTSSINLSIACHFFLVSFRLFPRCRDSLLYILEPSLTLCGLSFIVVNKHSSSFNTCMHS